MSSVKKYRATPLSTLPDRLMGVGKTSRGYPYSWVTPVLDEVDDTSIFKTGHPARYPRSFVWLPGSQMSHPLQRAIAQRFSALAHFGHRAMSAVSPLCAQKMG